MAEHELEKLLGGFSADTLTAEEREQLYAARSTTSNSSMPSPMNRR
jgi:hypothetical protein